MLQKYYYKIRIILTFCIVTFILVLIMSRVSYRYIRGLYLDQLSQQVQVVARILAKQIDEKYLKLLQIGRPGNFTKDYFGKLMAKYENDLPQSEFFIFDSSFTILLHSNDSVIQGKPEPRLLLNQKEIYGLEIQSSAASLPFKGNDGNWYLWAFYRLDNNLWLGSQEGADQLQKVEEFSLLFWYIGLAGILATIILGWLVARTITRPIDRLAKFSSEIGRGDLSSKIPAGMKGEIKLLSEAMDKMRQDIIKSHKDKEKMLAQIAHEIRNPLGGIELLANLTREDILSGKSNIEYLDNILKEIHGLKSLITAYLNYSRPYPAKPEWVKIRKLFNEIDSKFKEQMSRKDIEFEINIFNEKVWFDPVHLKQVLINLISNSIDSIIKNGTIFLESAKNEKEWKIIIRDNGKGIKNENAVSIFDPFFTTKKNGTGLGLAISKKFCEENKSKLHVENNPAGGCTFIITKKSDLYV